LFYFPFLAAYAPGRKPQRENLTKTTMPMTVPIFIDDASDSRRRVRVQLPAESST